MSALLLVRYTGGFLCHIGMKKNMGSIDAASYRQVNQPDQYIAPIDQSIMQMGQQATVWKQCVP